MRGARLLQWLCVGFTAAMLGCGSKASTQAPNPETNPDYKQAVERTQEAAGNPFSKGTGGGNYPGMEGMPTDKIKGPSTTGTSQDFYKKGGQAQPKND